MRERRKARRYGLFLQVAIEASIKNGLASCNGKTIDISTRGVSFVVESDLEVGRKLCLTIELPTGPTGGTRVFIRGIGKVVRVEKRSESGIQSFRAAAVILRYEYTRSEIPDSSAQQLPFLV
jgi:c-di-GMP-binding flagellar brake protein YcgR